MKRLDRISNRIKIAFRAQARRQSNASMFVKVGLVIGGATIAALCQCVELAHANEEFSPWTLGGIAGAIIVAIGGAFIAITETDTSTALETARDALEEARARDRAIERLDAERLFYDRELYRALVLYNAMDVMRGSIEQSLDVPGVDSARIIDTCLTSALNSLLIALKISIDHTWTICVYRAQRASESDKAILKCVAQVRTIHCDLSEARTWQEGVGVAGISYANDREIIVSDMREPQMAAIFNAGPNQRSYDNDRYRSMVSVPIKVGQHDKPWGVVTVTTDQATHFNLDVGNRVTTSEPARAIAAMAGLAIKTLGGRPNGGNSGAGAGAAPQGGESGEPPHESRSSASEKIERNQGTIGSGGR